METKVNAVTDESFDVIIVGGSYSGLAAGMALGRSLRKVLIIDSGKPCNRFTPHSHNFITQDGKAPGEIAALAREQVKKYNTVKFLDGIAAKGENRNDLFYVSTDSAKVFSARKLIIATGIRDLMPDIPGFEDCWGKSVIHCPYCHGYEVRNEVTGILANGDFAFEFAPLVSNLTHDLTIYTNGKSLLTEDQTRKLSAHRIRINEDHIERLVHTNGNLQKIQFKNGSSAAITALYAKPDFVQQSTIPEMLGCELSEGFIKVDSMQRTTVPGVFASGDNTSRLRTVANAVSSGTFAGMVANKEMVAESFS